jgi:formate hydrogenlyase subunit 3/multisubunit Na+/H+ antiporter MnhD subunit
MARLQTPMSILPLIPILILLGGVFTLLLCRAARFVHYDAVASAAALLALVSITLLAIPDLRVRETLISSWQPTSVFGTPVAFRVDRVGWMIGLVAILACGATALAGIAYPGQRRFGPRALALGMTAGIVAAAFSANMLTLALAWGLFDAFFVIAALMQGDESAAGRRAAFAVGFNIAATFCLWIAALAINQGNESQYWHVTQLPEGARQFLALAAILRLGLFPFSQWLPAEREDVPGRVALLYVLPPLAGLHLLIRMASLDALPQEPAVIWFAALSVLVGGALAWWRGASQDALPYLSLSTLGVVVLAGVAAAIPPAPQAILLSGAVSWTLAIVTLSLNHGFHRRALWWSFGQALAVATLVGIPASAGFAVRTSLASAVAWGGNVLLLICVVAGETLAFATMARLLTTPNPSKVPQNWRDIAGHASAIALAALPPFLLPAIARRAVPAIVPPAFAVVLPNMGVAGSVIFILPIALAVTLEWLRREGRISLPPIEAFGDLQVNPIRVLSLDWLYHLVFRLANVVASALNRLSAVIEGEGAVVWALLILLAAYVVLTGAIR